MSFIRWRRDEAGQSGSNDQVGGGLDVRSSRMVMDGLDEVRWCVVSAEPIGPISQPAPVEEWTPQDWALAKLTYLARRRPLTIADLIGIDRTAGRLELIDGVLLMTPNPDADHLRRSRRLANTLDTVVPEGCEAIEGINVFEPGSDRVIFMPDVAVIVSDKLVRVPGQGEGVFPDGSSWSSRSPPPTAMWILEPSVSGTSPGAFRIWWSIGPLTRTAT